MRRWTCPTQRHRRRCRTEGSAKVWSTVPAPLALGTWSTFQKAVAVSLLLHAGLLTVRFVAPTAWERVLEPPPLEVVLVNARGHSKPVAANHRLPIERKAEA